MPFYWGVDSAEKVTKETYDCVLYNFGKPLFWGRYLSPIPGKVAGLTRDEAELLHNSGTKVLPIFSNFSRATGYRNGRVIAQNCVFHARRLGIPKGKIIFANLEKDFEIDIDIQTEAISWEIDPQWMERIIENLLQNVIRHASDGKYIGFFLKDGQLLIKDHGTGFQEKSEHQGAGIGLTIVNVMINEMG
ncbi:MAG: hypothetical protein LOD92_04015, partial [Bacillales bacterium]